jgi:hypothetical protein
MKNKLQIFAIAVSVVIAFFTFSQEVFAQTQRNSLIEFCTGTWCQWCPCGDITIENLLVTHPNLIPLAYHGPAGQDPFSIFPGNEIIGLMGFTGYPTATVDRSSALGDYTTWTSKVNTQANVPATVSLEIERTFNTSTGQLDATVNMTALENLSGQFKYNLVLTEDSLIYNQTNNGACVSGGTNWVHYWTVRAMINGASGEDVNTSSAWNQGEMISKTVSYSVPLTYNAEKCYLIAFVYKQASPMYLAQVQQAEKWPLIAPDYLVSVASSSPDAMVENSGSGDFSATLYNIGLQDDSYTIDVTMDAPSGWSGEFTTPNGTFPFGQQDEVAIASGDSLNVDLSVLANVINGFGEVTIKFTSVNQPFIFVEKTFRMVTVTGVPGLIVDASGAGYGDVLIDGMNAAFDYDFGIVSNDALYPSVDLTDFTLICWSTGDALPVFTQDEVNALTPFLDNGGRLLINGQDIGQDIFDASGQSQFAQSFYNNYLHANYVDDVGLAFFFRGIDGDPISNQVNFSLSSLYPRSPDQFDPYDATAASLFTFSSYTQYNSLRADDGNNRVVYLGFGLEQIADKTIRDTIITRSINWLMNGVVLNTPNEDFTVKSFNLEQNYPNPFNPSTTISYTIPNESQVSLVVYDIMGRQVAELVNSKQLAGDYNVNFDAASLASGTYFYKLTAGEFISVKKMVLLK